MSSLIHEILESIQKCNILVVGDIILDHYAFGAVKRVSPEAPIQVLDVEKEEYRLGGACNVAYNISSLGGNVSIVGIVGEDNNSSVIRNLLEKLNIDHSTLFVDPNRPTTTKTRFISQGHHLLRADREIRAKIGSEIEDKIYHRIQKSIDQYDGIIVSDYAKGLLTEDLCFKLIELAKKSEKKIFVGPKGNDWSRYRGATLISANRSETQVITGINLDSKEKASQAAEKLTQLLEIDVAVVTLGPKGMFVKAGDESFYIQAEAREVFDVAGAGDTVLSVLSLIASGGYSWKNAARLANAAAGIVVAKVGTSTVSAHELEVQFSHGQISHLDKIKKLEELLLKLEWQRSLGRVIVFTHIFFQEMTAEHIRYLEHCRSCGDILVVGAESEKIESFEMIAALSSVDYVFKCSETSQKIWEKITADVYITSQEENANFSQKGCKVQYYPLRSK